MSSQEWNMIVAWRRSIILHQLYATEAPFFHNASVCATLLVPFSLPSCPPGPGNISPDISSRGRNPCLPTNFQTETAGQSSKQPPGLMASLNAIPAFQLLSGLVVSDEFTHWHVKGNTPEKIISLPDRFQFHKIPFSPCID